MPMFMDVHTGAQGLTQDQLMAAHRQDQSIEKKEGVHFIKAWADPKAGKIFCLSEGPTREAVLRVHEKAGNGTHEIYEVPLSVE